MTGTASEIVSFLMEQDRNKVWDIKEHKERRSLDANAYFHVLCDKLRQKVGISMSAMKNHLIADYGQIEYINGEAVILKTNVPDDYMKEQETLHTKLVKVTEENDREVYFYRVYRGSHTYDTGEMSKLIDGTITECQQVGIETLTPDEIKRLESQWQA